MPPPQFCTDIHRCLHLCRYRFCRPIVFGDRKVLEHTIKLLSSPLAVNEMDAVKEETYQAGALNLVSLSSLSPDRLRYGHPTRTCGKAMVHYVTEAVKCAVAGTIDAITTAPISKKALSDAGYSYPGHTELLAELTGCSNYVMMLAGDKIKVALVTIHCALHEVFHLLTAEKILTTIRITHEALRNSFGKAQPNIGVAGLNPHAGEKGLFGHEEKEIILPAVERARQSGIRVEGPLPPDTIFYHASRGKYDVVVCMYHDQGLIPLKLLHFEDAVNITLGLPIIRTSVDHGTAYDIAGTGKASPSSLLNALKTAALMQGKKRTS